MLKLGKAFEKHTYGERNIASTQRSRLDMYKKNKIQEVFKDIDSFEPISIIEPNLANIVDDKKIDLVVYMNNVSNNINNNTLDILEKEEIYTKSFCKMYEESQINDLKKEELLIEKFIIKHSIVAIENNSVLGYSGVTHGKIMPVIFIQQKDDNIIFKKVFMSNEFYEDKRNNLSLLKITMNKNNNITYNLLESKLFNKYIINNQFDINSVQNARNYNKFEKLISDNKVNNVQDLGIVLKTKLLKQKYIMVNDQITLNNSIINLINNEIIVNRFNITSNHINIIIETLLNN